MRNTKKFVKLLIIFKENEFLEKQKVEEVKEDPNSLSSQFLKCKSDIEHMNNQYQEYILKSLEYDYNDFLKYIEETYPTHCTNGYSRNIAIWHFDELKYNEFILIKGNSSRESIN